MNEQIDSRRSRRSRMNWMRGLKVGDVVCDCRFKHVKIAQIKDEVFPWRWFHRATRWMPLKLYYFFQDLAIYVRWSSVQDKDLQLEDGAHCSAMSCCDSVEDGHTEEGHAAEIADIDREQEEIEKEMKDKGKETGGED
jgi:hypothetical protein